MVRGDDLNYAHAAYELANGKLHFDYWLAGTSRIGLYAPVALLYRIFGPSEVATLAFPFLSSLLTVIIIYGIGKLLDGQRVGLVAALLWACLPLDIFLASDLLADGPVATFSAAAIYFLLLAERSQSSTKAFSVAASLLCLLWAILIKPIAIVTLFFLLIYTATKLSPRIISLSEVKKFLDWSRNNRKLMVSILGTLLLVLIIGYAMIRPRPLVVSLSRAATDFARLLLIGETHIDLSDLRLDQIDLFVLLGPLFLIASVVLILEHYSAAAFALLWGGFYFIYYEWGSMDLNPFYYRPILFAEERSLLFTLVPMTVIAGLFLGKEMEHRFAAMTVTVSAILVSVVVLVFGQWVLQNPTSSWVILLELMGLSAIIASPFVLRMVNSGNRQWEVGVLVVLIALALIKPTSPYNAGFWQFKRDEMANYRQVAQFLSQRQEAVFINSHGNAIRLNYVSDFQMGFDWAEEGRNDVDRINVGLINAVTAGSFYVTSVELSQVPSSWREVFRVERGAETLVVYQVGVN